MEARTKTINELTAQIEKLKKDLNDDFDNETMENIMNTELQLNFLNSINKWCLHYNVDRDIVFEHIYYATADDEDEDGFRTNNYEFILDNELIYVFLSFDENENTRVEVEQGGGKVKIKELPEKCKVAVNAIIDNPYYLL